MARILSELCHDAEQRLAPNYGLNEARWMVRIIFEHLKGYSQVDLIMKADMEMSDFIEQKVDNIINRLLEGEPIQYIFGQAKFYGMTLKVTPDTLIPRPETEELVDTIVRRADGRRDLRVLDIGTGSGCIAIALARNLVFPSVEAIDISPAALAVAKENAKTLKTNVYFRQADALHLPEPDAPLYDIIVSNPPYIAQSEATEMSANVLDHEPHTALFVPDDDPLLFYRAIARYATKALRQGGLLCFEINPLFATELKQMLEKMAFNDIDIVRDMQKRQRFIFATL